MKLATWNVNSIRKRTPHICAWLHKEKPDILLLQELKCQTSQFPEDTFAQQGYNSYIVGQKSYNGVAFLTRQDVTVTEEALPSFESDEARYIEVKYRNMIIGNLYAPNGNSGGMEGYQRKLDFMVALTKRAKMLLTAQQDFLFAGDFNICPTDQDLAPETLADDDALIRPQSRATWRRLLWLGLTDAYRALHPLERAYSFWGYQNMCFQRDKGLRIDAALLSPNLAQNLKSVRIDNKERAQTQPSDHVPFIVDIDTSSA